MPTDEQSLKKYAFVSEFHQDLLKTMKHNDDCLDKLLQESPSCSDSTGAETFELSDTTLQSISVIEEMPLDFADWVDAESKNKWVSRTLKLFLFT